MAHNQNANLGMVYCHIHLAKFLIGQLIFLMLVLKVRFGYTKFMLILINQCLAETLHAIEFKNDWYVFHRRC